MNLKSLRNTTSFENIKLNILSKKWISKEEGKGCAIAFASRRPGEGVSTIIAGVAEAFSKSDIGKIFILDCAPAPHRVTDILSIQAQELTLNELGKQDFQLSNFIAKDETKVIDAITLEKTDSYISQHLIKRLIHQAKQQYKAVLIDLGSLSRGGAQWLTCSNYRVFIIDASKNTYEILEHQKKELEHMGITMDGFVINKRKYHIPRFFMD